VHGTHCLLARSGKKKVRGNKENLTKRKLIRLNITQTVCFLSTFLSSSLFPLSEGPFLFATLRFINFLFFFRLVISPVAGGSWLDGSEMSPARRWPRACRTRHFPCW
jgi:hypothetical protein